MKIYKMTAENTLGVFTLKHDSKLSNQDLL